MKHPYITRGEDRNPTYIYANQRAIRDAFWEAHPQFFKLRRVRKRQNDYPDEVREAFVNFVDGLEKSGQLSRGLAMKVEL